jgi:TolB-like protein/Flp pilus assembly protein TadD
VLPFENLGSAEQEYFADGLTDEVSTKLSGLSGLAVIAHSSAMHYKKSTKSIQEIGAELGVGYLLEGTIRWEESDSSNHKTTRLRVNPRLIKVMDGTQVWSQSLEGTISGIFKIQSDIAQEVAAALNVVLLQHEGELVQSKPTENPVAYDYYIRGNDYVAPAFSPVNLENAIKMYEKAIEADPKFALAYARLGRFHTVVYFFGIDRSNERLRKAKDAIDKAFELHPDLAEAHIAYGYYFKNCFWDLDHAIEEFTLARNTQPNDADLLHGLGICFYFKKNFEEGIKVLERAVELDPRSAQYITTLGNSCYIMGKFPEGKKYLDKLISYFPDNPDGYYSEEQMYLFQEGKTENARKILGQLPEKLKTSGYEYELSNLDVMDRKYESAMKRITASIKEDTVNYYSTAAYIAFLQKQVSLQHSFADSAITILQRQGPSPNDTNSYRLNLSLSYALAGRKNEAVREYKKVHAFEYEQVIYNITIAKIELILGDDEGAIDLLKLIMDPPKYLSVPLIQLDPLWDPLRNNPRFQKLIAENK